MTASRRVGGVTFGTAPLGSMPDPYGYSVDDDRARATIRAIFDSPAFGIDTSRNYGFGRSETRIGEVIRERGGVPDGFVLSTKIDRDMDTGRFDAAQARRSLEASLEALSVDQFDVLHLHDPEHSSGLEQIAGVGGALEELFRMRDEGLTRSVGLAMGRVDIMVDLVRDHPFDVILNHNRYTLLNRHANGLYDLAAERGIDVWNAAPFAGGVLAKGADAVTQISYQPVEDEALDRIRSVERVCAEAGVPMGAAALQFSMNDPRIATTVVGVTKPERVESTLHWATVDIPAAVWEALSEIGHSVEDPEAQREYKPG